jgi:hypothetical protein
MGSNFALPLFGTPQSTDPKVLLKESAWIWLT